MMDQLNSAGAPRLHQVDDKDLRLACHEWRPALRGSTPTVLLVHATGFHGRVWQQTVDRLPHRHVIAPDLRGHGGSPAAPFSTWEPFGSDLASVTTAFDLQGALGVGHSMGAHALVQAAALEPGRFAQLLLVDPVLRAPSEYLGPPVPAGSLHPAAGRKNHFESARAMFERFVSRPPYALFDPAVLRDYCEYGLRPAPSGSGFELCCAPAFEGSIYPLARQYPGIYACIRSLDIPVWVVRSREQDPTILPWDPLGSPTWPGLTAEFRQGHDQQFKDHTHFLPMEAPALMARLIEQAGSAQDLLPVRV